MKKYVYMVGGVALTSIIGGAFVVYALLASSPFSITRQDTLPEATAGANEQLADGTPVMTITIR